MRTTYQTSLLQLKKSVVEMADEALSNVESSLNAFRMKDIALAKKTIEKDNQIDAYEEKIAKDALRIIWKEQPIAQDLRLVTTILKVITDIERIGDHATDISEIFLHMEEINQNRDVKIVLDMAEKAIEMVRQATNSLVTEDQELAKITIQKDDEVDFLYNTLIKKVTEWLKDSVEDSSYVISVLLIGKYLERVADHAVNIAEWVIFLQSGSHKNTQLY